MLTDNPIIALLGAGAVGGYYGGRLAQHGHDVHFLVRSDYDAIARNGWTIRSCDGDFTLAPDKLRVYSDVRTMPKADLVIVTFKATSNDQYEPLIRPLLKEDTLILTLQNGLGNEEQLAKLFGAQRIIGGLAFVCINRIAPGVIHHLEYGLVKVGEFIEGQTDRAKRIVEMFTQCRIKTSLLTSLKSGRWEKLVWNIPFSGLGATLDMDTVQLLSDASGVELLRKLMEEVVMAARANGGELPPRIIDEKMDQTRNMGAYRSSMQIDRQEGRPMEVEAILGEPVRAAGRKGVHVPYMSMLYQMAKLVNVDNIAKQGKGKQGFPPAISA